MPEISKYIKIVTPVAIVVFSNVFLSEQNMQPAAVNTCLNNSCADHVVKINKWTICGAFEWSSFDLKIGLQQVASGDVTCSNRSLTTRETDTVLLRNPD
jgi:hypothetical protein